MARELGACSMEISAEETLHGEHDYLQVARTLRDKLDGLITSRATDLGTQRKILLDVSQELALVLPNNASHQHEEISTCTHSCCEHEQIMNPGLWCTLPMELLHGVFAKLPFPDICRLQSLSKEWQLSLQSSSSEFTLALKDSSPKMLAQVTCGRYSNFELRVLDGRNNRWHELDVNVEVVASRRLLPLSEVKWWLHMNGAADGGLVCYIEKHFKTGLNHIFVCNPKTGVVMELPTLNVLEYSVFTMMQIVVDRNTHCYKVIVVKHGPPVDVEVYDSEVRQWTKPKPSLGRIFGIAHHWSRSWHENVWSAQKIGPCAYDCHDGKFYDFEQDQEKWLGQKVISYTLMKDRLFVLHWEEKEFSAFISEYGVPENSTSWVKKETHDCCAWCFWRFTIHAWNGFVFLFNLEGQYEWVMDPAAHKKQEYGWVYDLSTCAWRTLPTVPWWSISRSKSFLTSVVCELNWNIQP